MTAPFQPKADRPQWEIVYDLLVTRDIGDIVTYDELTEALGYDIRDNRKALYKAARVWGEDCKRALAPVVNTGYRVVEPAEHERLARQHHLKSRRALRRGRSVIRNADRSLLSAEEVERFDRLEQSIARHSDLIRRLDARTERLEKTVRQTQTTTKKTDGRLAAIEEALRRSGFMPEEG